MFGSDLSIVRTNLITHNYWSVNVNLFFLRIDCWICAEIVTSIVADN